VRVFGFSLRQNELVIRRDAQAVTRARVEKRHFLARSHEIAHIDLTSRRIGEPLGLRAEDNSILESARLSFRHWRRSVSCLVENIDKAINAVNIDCI